MTQPKRVMVVDDEISNRMVAAATLEALGYRISLQPDGESAIEAATAEAPDLVLIDWRMPGGGGEVAVPKLKELLGDDVPVVVVSAYAKTPDFASRIRRSGCDDILGKPYGIDDLAALVDRLIGPPA